MSVEVCDSTIESIISLSSFGTLAVVILDDLVMGDCSYEYTRCCLSDGLSDVLSIPNCCCCCCLLNSSSYLRLKSELSAIEAAELLNALILASISSSVLERDIVKACEANLDWLNGVADTIGLIGVFDAEGLLEGAALLDGEEDKRLLDIIGVLEIAAFDVDDDSGSL